MFIKNIFNVKNYKGLEDGFKVEFDEITYIVGDNAKNKTTIGSLPLWILTGYNIYGSNKEQVANEVVVDKDFDKTFLKRCRAYDNNGKEFDITMVFNMLKNNKYISDGNSDTIVIKEIDKDKLVTTDKKVITY